jgi:hypothetical protein
MEIYFVFFFHPQKKKKETPTTLHTLAKPHEPTLQPKLCQRVQSCHPTHNCFGTISHFLLFVKKKLKKLDLQKKHLSLHRKTILVQISYEH